MPSVIQALLASYGGADGVGGTPGVATSVIFVDGAQHNTAANDKWDSDNPAIAASETGAHGRCYDNSAQRIRRAVTAQATYSAGVRFKLTSDVTDNIIRFMDTSSNVQVGIRYLAGGSLEINRGPTPTQLAVSSAGLISTGTWYYLEATATINNTTGSAQAKLYNDSGTLLATVTFASGDTQNTANAFTNLIDFGSINADSFTQHMWIDSSGALYGALRVETLYATGDGSTQQWTIGAGSGAHWEVIDEAQNNDATDFLQSLFNGHIELLTFPSRALSGAIHAIQASPVATRSASVGGMTFRPIARVNGSNYAGATKTLTDAWITHPHCWGTNPDTTLAWTGGDESSSQFGVERVAGTESTVSIRVTQCVLEILTAV